jgi:prepilin-type N-terminal cleavage/methylation domain-containing protein
MVHREHAKQGFTLLELMISMAVGLIVMSAIVMLFNQAMKVNWVTSQKAEMQQDFRASANLLQRDISMAGAGSPGQAGLGNGAIGLPVGGNIPIYPCSTTTCNYINGASVAYPLNNGAYYLYSILPGPNLGITVNGQTSDIITLSYTDPSLSLICYSPSYVSATQINFTLLSPTGPAGQSVAQGYQTKCDTALQMTIGGITPPNLVYSAGNTIGLQAGDTVMFTSKSGASVIGVVSSVSGPSTDVNNQTYYTVNFAAGDPGNINQNTATGSLASLSGAQPYTLTAVRQMIVTYYLDISPISATTPRLMRIQNGRIPVPVAENITYLKFNYDVDTGGVYYANQSTLPAGTTPNMITRVSIAHMVIRNEMHGNNGYQGLDLQTSISPRNLTFGQEFPTCTSNCTNN